MRYLSGRNGLLVIGIVAVALIGTATATAQRQSRSVDDMPAWAEPAELGPRTSLGFEPTSDGQLYVRRSSKGLCIGSDEGDANTEGCGLGVPDQRSIAYVEVQGERIYVIGLAAHDAHIVETRFTDGSTVRVVTEPIPGDVDADGLRFFHAASSDGRLSMIEVVAYDRDGQRIGEARRGG